MLASMFLENDEATVQAAFSKLGSMSDKQAGEDSLDAFKQGLIVFFVQSLHGKDEDDTKREKLDNMAKIAKRAMRATSLSSW